VASILTLGLIGKMQGKARRDSQIAILCSECPDISVHPIWHGIRLESAIELNERSSRKRFMNKDAFPT
jgi:hypothetical protein